MSDEYQDPSGNTQAFRAFAERSEPKPASGRIPPLLIIAGGVVAVVIVALALVLLLA
jgi:hypothetical protein